LKPTTAVILAAALLCGGCAKSVIPLYESAREAALAKPGKVKDDWKPDAVLHLSADALNPLIEAVLEKHGTLSEKLDLKVGTLTPNLKVKKLTLGPAKGCKGCIGVDAKLAGSVAWRTVIAKGKEDLSANLSFNAVVEVIEEDDQFVIHMIPKNLRDVSAKVAGKSLDYAEGPIEKWVAANVLDDIPPLPIAKLGSGEVPLRAVRASATGDTIQLQLLTSSPTPKSVAVDRTKVESGWKLEISTDSLVDLAAAASFENGAVGYSVVPIPTGLAFADGEQFTLDLRLWRIKGKGWWRDYEITGTTKLTDKGLKLKPESVEEAGQSPGADVADPLAMIGEGVILKTIEKALTTTLPSDQKTRVDGVKTNVKITDIGPFSNGVAVSGDLTVASAKSEDRTQKKGKR